MCMSPAPSGSLALQHIELGGALELPDAIIFDFYPGLPHILALSIFQRHRRFTSLLFVDTVVCVQEKHVLAPQLVVSIILPVLRT